MVRRHHRSVLVLWLGSYPCQDGLMHRLRCHQMYVYERYKKLIAIAVNIKNCYCSALYGNTAVRTFNLHRQYHGNPQRVTTWPLPSPFLLNMTQGNMIYVSSIEKLYALDAHTQAIVWTFASCKPITSKVVVSTDGMSHARSHYTTQLKCLEEWIDGVVAIFRTRGTWLHAS